jgi:tripartite-type tricarboxylate transporter receptor subunit TctC
MQRRLLLQGLGATALPALAQARPIRLVVPYPPGGPLDIVARALADKVKDALGPVIVENKAGAGGNLGADAVAKSAPDGSTIVMGAVATHAINPWLYARLPYDPIRDFTPITGVAQVPNVLVMNPDTAAKLGIRRVADLVAYAKQNPGRLNYGSGGNGSAGHLAGEMFKAQAGVFMVHIPYAGGNPAQLGLLSGQVDLNFDNLAAASANIKAGKLKALAVTTARRSTAMPDVPTIAETGPALARQHLVRPVRPRAAAGRGDAAAQQGLRGCAEFAGAEGAPRLAAGGADARHAGAVRGLREERAGEVRRRREGQRREDRVGPDFMQPFHIERSRSGRSSRLPWTREGLT